MKRTKWVVGFGFAILLLTGTVLLGQEIAREQLADALREGGYVIVMRHASSSRELPNETAANPDNKGRLLLSDTERMSLAQVAHRLGRKALEDVAHGARPDTILLAWYRKLIARKFDGSRGRHYPGRPLIDRAIEALIVRMARENPAWGYDRITGALANLVHRVADQTVGNVLGRHGVLPAPERKRTTSWAEFNRGHRAVLAATDFFTVEVMTLAIWMRQMARSPNLNAYAERWVKSIKDECLSKLILCGEGALRRAVNEYVIHYHAERNHQDKGNALLYPARASRCPSRRSRRVTACRQRLGGLLKYYHREAA